MVLLTVLTYCGEDIKQECEKIKDDCMTVKKFGDLREGDVIQGADGQPVTVTAAYDAHIPERMFEIELEDGRTIKASGNHLWYVETKYDLAYHRERRRNAKKVLGKALTKEMLDNLVGIAESEDDIETSLMDVMNLLEGWDNRPVFYVVERVVESIGHVSENSKQVRDLMTGETYVDATNTVRHYDARRIAQQILSLTGQRKYVKKYPLVVGKVVMTTDLLNMSDADIPVIEEHQQKRTLPEGY